MKKITILSLHLNHGGIQKYVSNVANLLSEKFNVKIVCVYKMCEPVYKINDNIKIEYLLNEVPNKNEFKAAVSNKNVILILKEGISALKILYKRNSSIKKYLKNVETDVIISTRILFTQYLKLCKKGIVKVAQEHRHHNNDKKYINRLGRILKYADYFMGASHELTEFYKKKFNNKTKYKFIPMPIEETSYGISKLDNKNIITVGRFSKEKGLDDLVDIFAEVNKVEKEWKLHLVGNGSEYNNILNKIKKMGLEKKIILHGFCDKDKVYSLYKDSSIYVMTSHEESFGLVLIEASMHSLPLVAFDSAQGACEIIVNKRNGYLIPNRDKNKMVEKIFELIRNEKLRKEIGLNALNESKKYEFDNLKKEYNNFFESISVDT